MIKRFSTLYVGHIELERCGHAGIPADDRRYPNERRAEVFDTSVAMAQAADELGYETLWLAEHHFQHERLQSHLQHPDASRSICAIGRSASRSAALSMSFPHGIRCGWPRTSRWPTS